MAEAPAPPAPPQPPAVPPPCARAQGPHDVTITLRSEGQVRSAVLHLPAEASSRRLALVIAFHGWGSNGARFERETGFDALADHRGFAVLYPSSAGPHWQISGPATDVTFIGALLARTEAVACIDRSRVYATGLSNGAGMVARLACDTSLGLAGAVPVAGVYEEREPCNPTRPVSLLEVHGTADAVVPYYRKGAYLGSYALGYAAAWAIRDGCAGAPTRLAFAPHAVLYRWSGCRGGALLEQLTLYGVGHGLPNTPGTLVRAPGSSTLSGIAVVWSFLAPLVLAQPGA